MSEKTYRIGEAADLLQLKSYVLRFWETEFTQLAPLRTDKGQRLYTEEHLELLRRIRHLLHEQGMTIDGARRVLAAELRHGAQFGREHPAQPVPVPGFVAAGVAAGGAVAQGIEPFVPHSATAAGGGVPAPQAGVDPDALRLVRDELLELRNLLLSQ